MSNLDSAVSIGQGQSDLVQELSRHLFGVAQSAGAVMTTWRRYLEIASTGSLGNERQSSDLDAILGATKLDTGGQLCTTTPQYVSGLSDNRRSESMVDRRSENSQSEGHELDSYGRLKIL